MTAEHKGGRRMSDADLEAMAPAVSKRQLATLAALVTLLLGLTSLLQNFFLAPIREKLDRVEKRVESIDNCFRDGDVVRRREYDKLRDEVDGLREAIYRYRGNAGLPERPLR